MRQYVPDARTYELMTVLSPDVPEDDISGVLDAISGYVTTAGGTVQEVLRDSPWGRRRLAYPIRHASRDVRDGYYTLYHFELAPNRVTDVERDLKLNTQVIRYLVTHYTPQPIDPRAQIDAEIDAEEAAAAAYAAAQAGTQTPSPAPSPDALAGEAGAAPVPVVDIDVASVAETDDATLTATAPADAPEPAATPEGEPAGALTPVATSDEPATESDATPGTDNNTVTGGS